MTAGRLPDRMFVRQVVVLASDLLGNSWLVDVKVPASCVEGEAHGHMPYADARYADQVWTWDLSTN